MNTHGLIFLKHTVGTQLGQPDVEDLMTLCLTGKRLKEMAQKTLWKEKRAEIVCACL